MTAKAPPKSPAVFFKIFGLGFALLTGVPLIALGLFSGTKTEEVRGRPTTPGRVLKAESYLVESRSDLRYGSLRQDSSVAWFVKLEYAYEVNGTSFTSTRQQFGPTDGFDSPEEAKEAFSPGKEVAVYYNPDDPQDAVLGWSKDRSWMYWNGLVFMGIGFALFALGRKLTPARPETA